MSALSINMMSTDKINVETFIAEVKSHPVIWDLNCQDNRYKTKKLAAWEVIARKFYPNIDERSSLEKMDFYRRLHAKWRNIRDSYVRCIKRGTPKRGYMYAPHLAFLNHMYHVNCSTDDDADASDDDRPKRRLDDAAIWTSDLDDGDVNTTDNTRTRKRSRVRDNDSVSLSNYQMEDEDRSFFESLLPAVREFNLDQKLEFRSEVLRLVKSIRCGDISSILIKVDPGEFH